MTQQNGKVVAKDESSPCGCRRVSYSDGTGELTPCVPCALIRAGNLQVEAGQLLTAAGNRLGFEMQQARFQSDVMRRPKLN